MGARAAEAARVARRVTAAMAAVALVLAWLTPLALVLADDGAPACCRGRCCCRPASGDTRCVSAACHCGEERRVLAPTSPLPDAVLAEEGELPDPGPEAGRAAHGPTPARDHARPVPHPPPRFLPFPSTVA
jgi:hypothetical protein